MTKELYSTKEKEIPTIKELEDILQKQSTFTQPKCTLQEMADKEEWGAEAEKIRHILEMNNHSH